MKNTAHTLTLNLTQPDRPLPESWRDAAVDIVRTKVQPALQQLAENHSLTVVGNRAKLRRLEVLRLPAKSSPWLARVRLNAETVLFVARHTLRLVHRGVTYQAAL